MVGVDLVSGQLGPASRLAVDQARWVAGELGAHVTLVHSYHPDEQWDPASNTFEVAPSSEAADARPGLDEAAASLRDAGIDCEVVVTAGTAGLAIVRQVLKEDADLAILGKRVTERHDGRRIGSVSLNVVRHCPCLVSVVKPGSAARPTTIVAAIDGREVGARVVSASAWMAQTCGASLHFIHAIQFTMEVQMRGEVAQREYVEEQRKAVRQRIDDQLGVEGISLDYDLHAGVTTPTRAVLESVERLQPDVVVMGTVSRGGVPGLLVGNTAERLLGNLDCSLLVEKPADFVCPVAPE